MSSTAPPTSPGMATMTKGTRNHVGSKLASAPTGLSPTALSRLEDDPASKSPKKSSTRGAIYDPNVVHQTTPREEALRGR